MKRKEERKKQTNLVTVVWLSITQGALLDELVNQTDLPYSHFVRKAVELLPKEPSLVQSPAVSERYPYRLGSSLLNDTQFENLVKYQELTGRSRSQCIRDAIALLDSSYSGYYNHKAPEKEDASVPA